MIKKIGAMFGVMLVALGLGLTAAGPAQAAGSCPTAWICFFDTGVSADYAEGRDWSDSTLNSCINMPSANNNITSYIVNRSSKQWRTYANAGCSGTTGLIYANSSGTMDSAHNNNISAYKRIS
jgi:Peptidase inhibitor family I36